MSPISVLIVSYRTPELTASAAASALQVGDVRQVIVVDNASNDDTGERLHALQDDRVSYIVNRTNAGYGQAANLAAAGATSDVVIFLNSDAEITPAAARALGEEVARHDGRCIAGPRLVGPDGTLQRSAGLLPAPSDLAVRALGLHHLARAITSWPLAGWLVRSSRLMREYDLALDSTRPISTTMVSGACFAIGRDVFQELDGFDEQFFMYFEDADLCRRATIAGIPIRYVPSAVVTHIGGGSSSEDYHFAPLHARSMRQYLGKWYGPAGSALGLGLLWLRAIGLTIALNPNARRAWRAMWAATRDEDPRR